MKKLLSVTLSLIMLLGLLAGCDNQAANDPSNDQAASEYGEVAEFISIGANPSGQTAYTWAAGIADLINKANIGATATAEETNGYPVNANMLASGELEFGFVNNWILAQAYAATDSYSDIQAGKVTGVISLAPTEMHVLTLPGSGVNSLADLAGKRVGVGQPGGISLEITTMMLECAGYQEGDFERLEINLANQCEYLRDGQLDVVIWIGSAALPAITELCATKDVVFLDVDDAIIEKMQEKCPVVEKCVIADGTYTDQTGDVKSFCVRNVLATSADVSNETVYQVTKLIMENAETLGAVHKALATISPETALLGLTKETPLHPGALRYYQEIGVPGLEIFE